MRNAGLLLLVALALPVISSAEEACPWMNAATAGGLLDGAVTLKVTHPGKDKDDVNCEFTRQGGSLTYSLRIEVQTMSAPREYFPKYAAQCRARGTPLNAIGNEAFACGRARRGQISEEVVSRVRDRAFRILIATNDPAAAQGAFREKAASAAEQVAGNLF